MTTNILTNLPPNWRELTTKETIELITDILSKVVKESSLKQTFLGLLVISPIAGIKYVAKKMKKAKKN